MEPIKELLRLLSEQSEKKTLTNKEIQERINEIEKNLKTEEERWKFGWLLKGFMFADLLGN